MAYDQQSTSFETPRQYVKLDQQLPDPVQADPILDTHQPASSTRIALFAVAIAVALGAAFYGLNNGGINPGGTATTSTASAPAAPVADANKDDNNKAVMNAAGAKPNSDAGVTTGAAPAKQASPPSSQPTGVEARGAPANNDATK